MNPAINKLEEYLSELEAVSDFTSIEEKAEHFGKINIIKNAIGQISFRGRRTDTAGNQRATFEGRLSQCRACGLKAKCMKNPSSADHRKGQGRQVSFATHKKNRRLQAG